jgi:saposin
VIENGLDYICELTIFTRILRKQCEQMIDTYVDSHINYLLDLLRSDVDPNTICKVLDFCSTPPNDELEREDAAVYYDNIVLHIPASNLQITNRIENKKPVEHLLVGAKKCTWGPSYWCGNLTTAKECQTTSHCIDKYWSRTQYSDDNDSVCQVCKDMVKQARDQLLSNETQEELIEVLEGSCKLIPLKEIRKECIKLADEFVPELTEVLASQMNPTAVCTVAGLCNSARIDQMLAVDAPPKTADFSEMDSCVNCTVAFTAIERFMQSATKEDVQNRMLAVCGQLSSYSDLCATLIVSNIDDMYDLLQNQLPAPAACHLTGMCSYRYHAHVSIDDADFQDQVDTMLAAPNDDLPCDLCKQLVHHLQEILVANTTEDEFHQMLDGMCQQTGKFRDECVKLVDENFQVVYRFLTEELDPSRICAEIQICPRSKNYVSDANLNLIAGHMIPALKDEVKLTNLMPVSPMRLAASASNDDEQVDNVECRFCHTIIGVMQSELKDPAYEKDVEKVIFNVIDARMQGAGFGEGM